MSMHNVESMPSSGRRPGRLRGRLPAADGRHRLGALDVDAEAPADVLEELKQAADDHCPGVFCILNPIDLRTHLHASS